MTHPLIIGVGMTRFGKTSGAAATCVTVLAA